MVSLVFLLIHLVPGDPIVQMLGEGATPADIRALRHQYGLDQPLWTQYLHYWAGVLHGDLGNSIRLHDTVAHLIAQRYPYTLALTLTALGLGLVLAVPAGILAAVTPRPLARPVALRRIASSASRSRPRAGPGADSGVFHRLWAGCRSPAQTLAERHSIDWRYLVLPSVAMGASLAAILTRMVRTAMLEELGQDYIRTARAKGLSERPWSAATPCPTRWSPSSPWWACSSARCWPEPS